MKRFLSIFYFITFTAYASVQTHNVYFLGHSLVNFNMPAMFEDLCIVAGISGHQQAVTVGNGASLSWQWTSPSSAQGPEYPTELATGLHDVFVMTEAVPLKNHLQWSNTYGFANNFHDLAQQYVANCQTYMYETWHCISSGTPTGCAYDDDDHIAWRTRLTNDLILWESIADSVNLTTTGPPMFIIPAGQCMAALYDSIEAGAFLPTYDSIIDIFDDDIHLTDVGNYFISLVMYATIYKSSPVGLTNQTSDIWNVPFNAPSVADATKMQELVWNVVCNYARSGVSCGATAIANTIDKKNNFTFYPNPVSSDLLVCEWDLENEAFVKIELLDVSGRKIKKMNERTMLAGKHKQTVDLSDISSGICFIKMQIGDSVIIDRLIRN